MITIDARGYKCPLPVIRLQRAIDEHPDEGEFLLIADDPMARIDVPYFCRQKENTTCRESQSEAGFFHISVLKT